MSRISLVLVLSLSGCMFMKSKPTDGGCKTNLSKLDDARMACIIDGKGNSNHIGETFAFSCPAFEVSKTMWVNGADPFALSSSICYAAVYAGKITPAEGGAIKIKIVPPQNDYPAGEVANGIKSNSSTFKSGAPGYTFVD